MNGHEGMKSQKVALLVAKSGNDVQGGAERFYKGLAQGLEEIGCHIDVIEVDAGEATYEDIVSNYDRCAAMDLDTFDLVISTKVPTYAVRHKNHVLYLVHTVRAFDDMFESCFPEPSKHHLEQRAAIHDLDRDAMRSVKKIFTIGHEVSRRLYKWTGLPSEVLHPPLMSNPFKAGPSGDYLFLAGRLHRWKRVDLIIQAVKQSSLPIRLLIAGVGEAESDLRELAGEDNRIEFLGRVSDEDLVAFYQGAFAVPFVPQHEDYGYITLEAFASAKPVITCKDSGEPAFFVRQGFSGLLAEPTPESICQCIEWLYKHPEDAVAMGLRGADMIDKMSWKATAQAILDAGIKPAESRQILSKVVVIDMQPIHPAVGGGRLRLQGLYHNLGKRIKARYIGSYDWPGEAYREYRHSETLLEIDVPLSTEHHLAAQLLSERLGGKSVIDMAFSEQGLLSEDYLGRVQEELLGADVVIFSHPWVYPLVKDLIRPDQLVIYDSQNVEGYLRAQLLDQSVTGELELLQQVVRDEYLVGMRADWIWACSQEDLLRFNRVYGFDLGKMRVVPNGVMAYGQSSRLSKIEARQSLGISLQQPLAIFLGSQYGPNVEAATFIIEELASRCPEHLFVIAGGVGQAVLADKPNVIVTGMLDQDQKALWLAASDMALNPMFSGSGTNIKMFEFMAWSMPVISTETGARGIELGGEEAILIVPSDAPSFVQAMKRMNDISVRNKLGEAARFCVERGYAWENISQLAGSFISARARTAGQKPPKFSVVIPSYERHDQLNALMQRLADQVEKDFEVVVVDQSDKAWPNAEDPFGFPLAYYHSPVKGAVRARNHGATIAQGQIIAFVDDDCLPEKDWLQNARGYFEDINVVGVEGAIYSDHLSDPDWRPVTNEGFEGLGFMTANLFIRSDAFQFIGGFDLDFDRPHFREDTDLGWRLQVLGAVPYASDVQVFHPAQSRSLDRESQQERVKFFQKDALLCSKHPVRYEQLFKTERHYQKTPGFLFWLSYGFNKYGKTPPEWLSPYLTQTSAIEQKNQFDSSF